MGVGLPLWRKMTGFTLDTAEGDSFQRNLLFFTYILMMISLITKPKQVFQIVKMNPLLILFLVWGAASIVWATNPELAMRRILALYLTFIYAISLYFHFPGWSLVKFLGITLLFVLVVSMIVALFFPSWGVMSGIHEGAWRGVFLHKNTLGNFGVLALILFGELWRTTKTENERKLWAAAMILSILIIFKSDSKTAYILTFIVIAAMLLIRYKINWKANWQFYMLVLLYAVGLGLAAIIWKYETIRNVLITNETFSGRVPLWQALINMGLNKPLGFGYGNFWVGENYPSGKIWEIVQWEPPTAHNGYLDIWLGLGWVGLGACFAILGYASYRHFKHAWTGQKFGYFWIFFIGFLVILNITESELLDHNSLLTVLLFISFFTLTESNNQLPFFTKWFHKISHKFRSTHVSQDSFPMNDPRPR